MRNPCYRLFRGERTPPSLYCLPTYAGAAYILSLRRYRHCTVLSLLLIFHYMKISIVYSCTAKLSTQCDVVII